MDKKQIIDLLMWLYGNDAIEIMDRRIWENHEDVNTTEDIFNIMLDQYGTENDIG